MTVRLGLPAKLVATDASDTRMDWRNLVTRNTDGTIRTGLTWPIVKANLLVTPTASTGPMTVQVGAFDAIAARDNGVVYLCNDGITPASGAGSVVITAAPAAGSSRLDVVYAMQHDSSGGVTAPDTDNLPGIFVAAGNPTTGTPTKPAIPAAAVELATVLVPSGVTATNAGGVVITQTFQYTSDAGGTVSFPTLAALNLWTTAKPMQRATVLDDTTTANNGEYARVGTSWIQTYIQGQFRPYAEAAGVGTNAAGSYGNVVFPVGRFTVPPLVFLTMTGGVAGIGIANSITTAGCQAGGFSTGGSAIGSNWMWRAVQMTPTSAAG